MEVTVMYSARRVFVVQFKKSLKYSGHMESPYLSESEGSQSEVGLVMDGPLNRNRARNSCFTTNQRWDEVKSSRDGCMCSQNILFFLT